MVLPDQLMLLTALGRVLGFLTEGYFLDTLVNWGMKPLIRLPHGLIPLALYLEISGLKSQDLSHMQELS